MIPPLSRPFAARIAGLALTLILASGVAGADDGAQLLEHFRAGNALRDRGEFAEAVVRYEQAMALASKVFEPGDTSEAVLLNNLGVAYLRTGSHAKAEVVLKRAVAIQEAKLGPDDPAVASCLNNLAIVYKEKAEYAKAEPIYRRCLAIREKALGADHPDVAGSLNDLAQLLEATGKPAKAEPLLVRALAIREKALGSDHPDVATSLNNLAHFYFEAGDFAKAEPPLRRAAAIQEAKLGPDHPDVASSLNNLATLYVSMGQYEKAEPLFNRGLAIREKKLGPDHPDVAGSLNELARLFEATGKPAKAEPLLVRALAIHEKALGPDHPDVANSLINLAQLYETLALYAKAEPLLRRALTIQEGRFGPDHPAVAKSLTDLAKLYIFWKGDAVKAEPLLQRALAIQEAGRGPDSPAVTHSLDTLAGVYSLMGKHALAEPIARRVLNAQEARLGADHPSVASSAANLGSIYEHMGRPEQAEPLYRRALAIRVKTLGTDHPDVAKSLALMAGLLAGRGRWAEAADDLDRERRILRQYIARILPELSEADQLAFLGDNDRSYLEAGLTLALARRDDPGMADRSAAWVLNGKAVAQQALAQRALLARDAADPAAAALVKELTAVRGRLGRLTNDPPEPGVDAEHRKELGRLVEQERTLSVKLGRATGRPSRTDPWVEIAEVRNAIPADAVLVEVARFDVADFASLEIARFWKPARYAAWIIPPAGQGDVRIVDLGEARPIDEAVSEVREAIQAGPDAVRTRGEPEAEEALRAPMDALAALILKPLLPHIRESKRWLLSPDAALWLVPWAALPLGGGRFALEDHEIRYLVSGRDLATAAVGRPAGKALMMADPDYDLDPKAARDGARKILHRQAETLEGLLAQRGASRSLSGATFHRLPGTAAEARDVVPSLRIFAGSEPLLFTGPSALEAVFKASASPKVVVLSTHGFFLDTPEDPPSDRPRPPSGAPSPAAAENPLLRCGLALAGANRRGQATGPGDEDGVLTGLEIAGTDLRGTDLVVLSACETGLGRVHVGEGVAGLRQAFQLAGAKTVVATLWKVPDKQTAQQMAAFFNRLAAGDSRARALRAAQLAQIEARRKRDGAAHPYYWAAFTLTGTDEKDRGH